MKLIVSLLVVVCLIQEIWSCGRPSSPRRCPPRDNTKPILTCPSDIRAIADPIQVNTKVTWTEPKANDARDGAITPRRVGPAPGLLFSGTTTITYSATDKGGNTASCSFKVFVRVITCSSWRSPSNGWKKCHPSTQMRYGGRCRFGCYAGHELVGASFTSCLASGQWDSASQPYCQKFQCEKLRPSDDQYGVVTIRCSDDNNYRSLCTYTCAEGYSVLPGRNTVRVCDATKRWKGDTPICVDTSAPEYQNCPYVKTAYAERTKTSGRVWWDNPTVIDNSGSVTQLQISGPSSGDDMEVGEYDVVYMAYDAENNIAFCEFKVIVKQISCQSIYPLPYTSVVCPDGRIYGSSCQFSCDNNTAINGHMYTECDKTNSDMPYGQWSFGDHQPYCELTTTCPALRPPDNGALACDTWLAGKYCQMLCQNGYLVMDIESIDSHKQLLVCGDSGVWYGSDNIPNCQEATEAMSRIFRLNIDYLYYNGSCSEDSVNIKEAFITAFTKAFGQCKEPDCSVANVQIMCGATTTRKRRSGTGFSIIATMQIPETETVAESIQRKTAIKRSIDASKTQLNLEVDGVTVEVEAIEVSNPIPVCPAGSAVDESTMQCGKCSKGYFHDTVTEKCKICQRGTYQNQSEQTNCLTCPFGKTTETTGASSLTLCIDACAPGYFSNLGTTPCSPCDIGTYSEAYATIQCTQCPGSKITLKAGATSVNTCQDFDIVYTKLADGEAVIPATLGIETGGSTDKLYVSLWVKCSSCEEIISIASPDGDTVLSLENRDNFKVTLLGETYLTEVNVTSSMIWKHILVKCTNESIAILIEGSTVYNEEFNTPLLNWIPLGLNITVGGDAFIGSISQLYIWKDYYEDIDLMFEQCFTNSHGDLLDWRQFVDLTGSYFVMKSQCDDFNDCGSTPCHNNGSCIDAIDSYNCSCANGFTGSDCETDIDDCQGSACDNDGVCVDDVNRYTCQCLEGFKGDLCEIKVVDGNWAVWDEWGACSETCGTGTQTRSRVCEDPSPDNGGKDCEGKSEETQECLMEECINECATDPTTVTHGEVNCDWIDDTNKTRVCNPLCHDGYEFDSDLFVVSSEIKCGTETGYVWNIRSEENPNAQLPSCTEIIKAKTNILNYTAGYTELTDENTDVSDQIREVATDKVTAIGCVASGRCSMTQIFVFSIADSSRRRRAVSTFVSFTLQLTCDPSTSTDECYDLLAEVVSALEALIQNLAFTVHYNGVDYNVGVNSSSLDGISVCEDGMVPVYHYCVPCGIGMYQHGEFCERCPLGYYQDEEGKLSCKQCPDGWTTSGLQARDALFCNVAQDALRENDIVLQVVLPIVGGLLILAAIVTAILYKMYKHETLRMRSMIAPIEHHGCKGNDNAIMRFPHRKVDQYESKTPQSKSGTSLWSIRMVTPLYPENEDVDKGGIDEHFEEKAATTVY